MTDLFLDCEWADVFAIELVSIGLVSLDGKKEFYAEREVLPADPTPWVVAVVYPLLERGDRALPDASMTRELRAFVAGIDHPRICYDFAADRELCQRVLDGADAPSIDGPEPLPDALRWHLMTDTGAALKRWWNEHPKERRQQHHALADAKALRSAWLSLWGA